RGRIVVYFLGVATQLGDRRSRRVGGSGGSREPFWPRLQSLTSSKGISHAAETWVSLWPSGFPPWPISFAPRPRNSPKESTGWCPGSNCQQTKLPYARETALVVRSSTAT